MGGAVKRPFPEDSTRYCFKFLQLGGCNMKNCNFSHTIPDDTKLQQLKIAFPDLTINPNLVTQQKQDSWEEFLKSGAARGSSRSSSSRRSRRKKKKKRKKKKTKVSSSTSSSSKGKKK